MALVGCAFAEHPNEFQEIYPHQKTESESEVFRLLQNFPDGLFDYYPDLKPVGFETSLKEASWLTRE